MKNVPLNLMKAISLGALNENAKLVDSCLCQTAIFKAYAQKDAMHSSAFQRRNKGECLAQSSLCEPHAFEQRSLGARAKIT